MNRRLDEDFWADIKRRQVDTTFEFRTLGGAFLRAYDVDGVGQCESKIEQLLAKSLRGPADKWGYEIVPQYEFGPFRYDFAIKNKVTGKIVALVECDGLEFHSSKKQILRDREKTKLAENSGYSMFRFTGREICADAQKCADWIIFVVYPR